MPSAHGLKAVCVTGIVGLILCIAAADALAEQPPRCCPGCRSNRPHVNNNRLRSVLDQARLQGRLTFVLYRAGNTAPGGAAARKVITDTHWPWLKKHFYVGDYFATRCDVDFYNMVAFMAQEPGPYWFVLKPDGQVLDCGAFDSIGKNAEGPWKQTVEKLIEDYPPIPYASRKPIAKLLRATREDFEAGDYPKVDRAMLKLALVWHPPELANPCQQLWSEFETEMNKRIGPADWMAIDGDDEGAVAAYEAILKDLGDEGKLGGDVRRKLDDLKAKIAEEAAEAVANAPRAPAEHDTPVAASSDAPDAADDSDDGPDADEPPPAPQPNPAAERRKANSLVQLAKSYHERGMKDKAIAKLEECLDKYPDTEAAKEARKLLARW